MAADGSLQRMNRAGLSMLDAESLDQVQGRCVYPLVSEEHREAFKAMAKAVFEGRPQTLEFKMVGLKGRPLWLYTHAVPLRNEQGEIVSALSTTVDLTERKLAEEALAASEERYRFFVEHANDAVLIHGFEENGLPGPFQEVNDLACAWTGYSREELARMTPRDLDDPAHQGHIPGVIEKLRTVGHAVFQTVW